MKTKDDVAGLITGLSVSLLCFGFTQIAFSNLLQILFWKSMSQSVDSSIFLHTAPSHLSNPPDLI